MIQNLKSAEELEEEDREAQAAKLQELIRRGTPRDLAAAQELMKNLSGANPESKPDYRQQALTELNKLESKVILLNEMLDNVDTTRGERFVAGDVYDVRFTSPIAIMSGISYSTGHLVHSKLVPCFQARAQKFKSGSPMLSRTTQNLLVSSHRYQVLTFPSWSR